MSLFKKNNDSLGSMFSKLDREGLGGQKKSHWLRKTFVVALLSTSAYVCKDDLGEAWNHLTDGKSAERNYKIGERIPIKIPVHQDTPTPN